MIGLNKEKERNVQITCEIDDKLDVRIKKIKREKGKRIGWLVKKAIQKYLDGEIVI